MPFEHACFISYVHPEPDETLTVEFIENLSSAFKSSLGPYKRNPVYLDAERLLPGYVFNEALAQAMCGSACWIVVYSPLYAEQDYTQREYSAMCTLEKRRRELLGANLPRSYGMIIPVVLRGGEEDIPLALRERLHYLDFRRFTTASPRILRNEMYVDLIDDVAKYIYEIFKLGRLLNDDCDSFTMPPPPTVSPFVSGEQPFPGRAGT